MLSDSPEYILGSYELECILEGRHGSAEWSCVGPAFFPQRPIEHLDTIISAGLAQPRHRRAGARVVECVTPITAFGMQTAPAALEAFDTRYDRVGHAEHVNRPGG